VKQFLNVSCLKSLLPERQPWSARELTASGIADEKRPHYSFARNEAETKRRRLQILNTSFPENCLRQDREPITAMAKTKLLPGNMALPGGCLSVSKRQGLGGTVWAEGAWQRQ
jgi:hypothetical protein